MAKYLPVGAGHPECRSLISFVRATHSNTNTLKLQSAAVTPSVLSGDEAKSFYEELCINSGVGKQKRSCSAADETENSSRKYDSLHQRKRMKKSHCQEGCFSDDRMFAKHNKTPGQSKVDGDISLNHGLKKTLDSESSSETACGKLSSDKATWVQRESQRIRDHKHSELLRLAQNGDCEGMKLLLEKGVDVDFVDQFGWTAVMSAAFEGHADVVEMLIRAGADLTVRNSQGYTALSLAQKKGHDIVVHLLECFLSVITASRLKSKLKGIVSFYCDVCKYEYFETDKNVHNRSIVHLFNMGLKPKDDSFLIPSSNVGFLLMIKKGWDGNRGLGPCGEGQRFPVKTVLKQDRKGLGNVNVKAKVTHFKANDKSAISGDHIKASKRIANVRTLSKRAQRKKELREKQWEINMRRELS